MYNKLFFQEDIPDEVPAKGGINDDLVRFMRLVCADAVPGKLDDAGTFHEGIDRESDTPHLLLRNQTVTPRKALHILAYYRERVLDDDMNKLWALLPFYQKPINRDQVKKKDLCLWLQHVYGMPFQITGLHRRSPDLAYLVQLEKFRYEYQYHSHYALHHDVNKLLFAYDRGWVTMAEVNEARKPVPRLYRIYGFTDWLRAYDPSLIEQWADAHIACTQKVLDEATDLFPYLRNRIRDVLDAWKGVKTGEFVCPVHRFSDHAEQIHTDVLNILQNQQLSI